MGSPLSGFSSMFYARGDHEEIPVRDKARTEEFIWAPSPTLGLNAVTYGGLLWGSYCTPNGLDWEGNDAPVQDDPTLEDYNVQSFLDLIVNMALQQNR